MNTDSRRIAKNTVYLFFRMLLTLVVAFYTSRVVLDVLGVDDYGIYNVVAGVVVLFSFLRGSLTASVQRFLNVSAADSVDEGKVYSTSLALFMLLFAVMFVALETVGLWFVKDVLNIPEGRMSDAIMVYQWSVATFLLNLLRIPDDALVMAREKMSFFAYVSVAETLMKLLVVFLLKALDAPKLVLYAMLLTAVTISVNAVYRIYCRVRFPQVKFRPRLRSGYARRICSFSGWNILGGVADIGNQQGVNMVVNYFCGVAFNATMGIALQVKNAVFSFVRNLLVAANPQLIKSYASGNLGYFRSLLFGVSKYLFFIMLVIGLPVVFNISFLLSVWLTDIPPQAGIFCSLMVVYCAVDALTGPLWTASQAEGNIKAYQITVSVVMLLNLPFSWVALLSGAPVWTVVAIQCGVAALLLVYRVRYLAVRGMLSAGDYLSEVIVPCASVTLLSLPGMALTRLAGSDAVSFWISLPVVLFYVVPVIFYVGLGREERATVISACRKLSGRLKTHTSKQSCDD